MKRKLSLNLWKIIIAFSMIIPAAVFITGCTASEYQVNERNYQPPAEYNIDELNQYGQWVDIPIYGRVWDPSVVRDWEPFHNGHWVYSDNNWTWISYEPFGWIVYHYGCWYDDSIYGWVWVPGNSGWSPATVEWRRFDDYVAWAPLPPRGVTYSEPWEEARIKHWHTVNSDSFLKDNVGRFRVEQPRLRNNNGDRTTTPQPQDRGNQQVRTRENTGDRVKDANPPAPRDLEKRTGRKIDNTPVVRDPGKTNGTGFRRMGLTDTERKRVDNNSKDVQRNVLVPKPKQNTPPKKDEKPESKKDDKTDERRR